MQADSHGKRLTRKGREGKHRSGATPCREEWDFRARFTDYDHKTYGSFNFLPPEEVFYCNSYEIARHRADAEVCVAQREGYRRKKFDISSFEGLLKCYWKFDGNGKAGIPPFANWFYSEWPEWPQQPYLSVKESERRRRFKVCWGHLPEPQLPLVKLADVYKDVEAWKKKEPRRRLRYWRRHRMELCEDVWTLRSRFRHDPSPLLEVAAFEIDYSLSTKTLAKLFENWIKNRRKAKGYRQRENRGPASQTDQLRTELLALGAGRLLQSGMKVREAIAHTKEVSGKPLYAFEPEWSAARKRAREILGDI